MNDSLSRRPHETGDFEGSPYVSFVASSHSSARVIDDLDRQYGLIAGLQKTANGRVLKSPHGRARCSPYRGGRLTGKRPDLFSAEKKGIDRPGTGSDHCKSSSDGPQDKGQPELSAS